MSRPRGATALLFVPVAAAFLLIYAPDVGHGFVKDDFAWILRSRVGSIGETLGLFSRSEGFYRPVVAVSFALNEWACGLAARCYGFVNLALALLVAGQVFAVGRAMGLAPGAAGVAASLWALNWHGVAMAVLWISGRTALVLLVFALAAALAVLKGWRVAAAVACLLALLSKEEAVLLPAILLAWAAVRTDSGGLQIDVRRAAGFVLPLGLSLLVYFLLRSGTAAYLPSSAPHFYRPTLSPALLGRNLLEYADRAATMAAVATLAVCAAARRWPKPTPGERRVILLGAVWCVAGYGLTVFLPVRSSLYAVFPSVGVALAAAAACAAVWREAGEGTRRWLTIAAGIAALALVPVHWSRNTRWVGAADVSAALLGRVQAEAATAPAGAVLLVRDDPGRRNNVTNAVGTLIEDAARLATNGRIQRAWIEPPPPDWPLAGLSPPRAGEPVVCLRLAGGAVAPCAP